MIAAFVGLSLLSLGVSSLQPTNSSTAPTPTNATVAVPQLPSNISATSKTPANITSQSLIPLPAESKEKPTGSISFFSLFKKKKAIGDSCQTTDDCDIKESFCVKGTCQCSDEYVASSNKQSCLMRARSLLDNCIETIQCEAGLNATGLVSCIAFKCICDFDAILVEGRCYKRKALGTPCDQDAECSVAFSKCIQGVCECATHMEPDSFNQRCIVMQAIDALTVNCTSDHMCSTFGDRYICKAGSCVCRPGYNLSDKRCVPELRLGDYCEKPDDCNVDMEMEKPGLRVCSESVCTCVKGYKPDKEVNLCKSGASSITSSLLILSLVLVIEKFI